MPPVAALADLKFDAYDRYPNEGGLMCFAGLCPDWQDWDPKDAVQNAAEAMGLADDWLNVRQVRMALICSLGAPRRRPHSVATHHQPASY